MLGKQNRRQAVLLSFLSVQYLIMMNMVLDICSQKEKDVQLCVFLPLRIHSTVFDNNAPVSIGRYLFQNFFS